MNNGKKTTAWRSALQCWCSSIFPWLLIACATLWAAGYAWPADAPRNVGNTEVPGSVRCVSTNGLSYEACGGVYSSPLTSIVTGQQAVTATATALPSNAGKVVCLKVKDTGTQTVYYGPTGVTTSTGMELLPGASMCRSIDNSNRIFVIAGATGSTVSFEILN